MLRKLLVLFLFTTVVQAQTKWQPEVKTALSMAKAANKLLFVEAYLPTCPACQAVEPIFSQAEVSRIYNTSFVNYKMNLSQEGQRTFLDERGIVVPSFPQFLFFDGDGNLVHQSEVTPDAASLIQAAKEALNPETRTANYSSRFQNGDRNLEFLVKYGVYTRLINDTTGNHRVADALFESFPKNDLASDNSWIITKKVVTDVDNGFFKYWIDHISAAAAIEKRTGHPGQENDQFGRIIQNSVFSNKAKSYSITKVNLLKDYMFRIGVGQYADTFLWELKALALIREGKKTEALTVGKNMAVQFKDNGPSLIYITKVFTENYPDLSFAATAQEWMQSAKALIKENNYLAEYYYEMARLNKRMKQNTEAKKNAQEALRYGKLAQIDTVRFEQLLATL